MKNKLNYSRLNYVASGFILALCASGLTPTVAQAAPLNEDVSPLGVAIADDVDTTVENNQDEKEFNARIILNAKNGSQVIEVKSEGTTLTKALTDYGVDPSDFRTSDNKPLNGKIIVNNDTDVSLFKNEVSGTSEIVKIKFTKIVKKTDDLLEGETKVEIKGKDGEALKTTLTTFNTAAKGEENKTTTESQLTVIKQPISEVTLVGIRKAVIEAQTSPALPEANVVNSNRNTPTSTRTTSNSSTPVSDTNNTANGTSTPKIKNVFDATDKKSKDALKSTVDSKMLKNIIDQVGKPYVWGASGPNAFDCSGLVYWSFTKAGKTVPRTSTAQGMGGKKISRADIQPGDLIWTTGHIGVYVGNGKVVHAANPKVGVVIRDLSYFMNRGFKISRY